MSFLRSKKFFLVPEDNDEIHYGVEMKPFVALTFNEEEIAGPATAPAEKTEGPGAVLAEGIKKISLWMRIRNFFHLAG
jgi:hypothetical protein